MKDKICPKCRGNGFVQGAIEEGRVPIVANCNLCNSQGEVHDKEFDDYFDSHIEFKSLQHNESN